MFYAHQNKETLPILGVVKKTGFETYEYGTVWMDQFLENRVTVKLKDIWMLSGRHRVSFWIRSIYST